MLGIKKREEPSEELIKKEELKREIEDVKKALELADAKFSYALEPELIDSCIYELKAGQLRYKFLLKQMKEQ